MCHLIIWIRARLNTLNWSSEQRAQIGEVLSPCPRSDRFQRLVRFFFFYQPSQNQMASTWTWIIVSIAHWYNGRDLDLNFVSSNWTPQKTALYRTQLQVLLHRVVHETVILNLHRASVERDGWIEGFGRMSDKYTSSHGSLLKVRFKIGTSRLCASISRAELSMAIWIRAMLVGVTSIYWMRVWCNSLQPFSPTCYSLTEAKCLDY